MVSRFLSLSGLILALCLLQGCSTPESQERLDTILCWLRPSCIPSQQPQSKAPAKPAASKRSPTPPKPKQPQKVSSQAHSATKCLTSAETTIHASKPFVTVSYVEPTTKADGKPLTDLDKTTIKYDLGKGLVKYKDCLATKHQGGGRIPPQKISFTSSEWASLQRICVTATNKVTATNENEGPPICKPIKK